MDDITCGPRDVIQSKFSKAVLVVSIHCLNAYDLIFQKKSAEERKRSSCPKMGGILSSY